MRYRAAHFYIQLEIVIHQPPAAYDACTPLSHGPLLPALRCRLHTRQIYVF